MRFKEELKPKKKKEDRNIAKKLPNSTVSLTIHT